MTQGITPIFPCYWVNLVVGFPLNFTSVWQFSYCCSTTPVLRKDWHDDNKGRDWGVVIVARRAEIVFGVGGVFIGTQQENEGEDEETNWLFSSFVQSDVLPSLCDNYLNVVRQWSVIIGECQLWAQKAEKYLGCYLDLALFWSHLEGWAKHLFFAEVL